MYGRAANRLYRAVALGTKALEDDANLQLAIRYPLTAHRRAELPKGPSDLSDHRT